MRTSALALLLGSSFLCASGPAEANGALHQGSAAPAATIDLRVAIAVAPAGGPTGDQGGAHATRWSRITVGASGRVLWLVPARPGAAIHWTSDAWLASLDDVTAPYVTFAPGDGNCRTRVGSERLAAWDRSGATQAVPEGALTIESSEASLRARASAGGFTIASELSQRIAALYARGWLLVAVDLLPKASGLSSSPTLRVSDDGGAELPFVIAKAGSTDTRVTAFAITSGPARIPGALDLDRVATTGAASLATRRAIALGSATWLRESAFHPALFDRPLDAPPEGGKEGPDDRATGQVSYGRVPAGSVLPDAAITNGSTPLSPGIDAAPEPCPVAPTAPLTPPPIQLPSEGSRGGEGAAAPVYYEGESCGITTSRGYPDDGAGGCSGGTTGTPDDPWADTYDTSGGDTSASDDADDSDDDSDDSSDDDSDDGSTDIEWGDDDSDDENGAAPGRSTSANGCSAAPRRNMTKGRVKPTGSPLSRLALFLVAIALPIRRLRRPSGARRIAPPK